MFAKLSVGTTYRSERASVDHNAIRQHDVAAACQGLDGLAWLVARYLWADDNCAASDLFVNMEALAHAMGFKGATAGKVSGVAMSELKDMACGLCRGAGEVSVSEHKRKTCPACKGYARRALSQRDRAAYAGVAETTWRRVYAMRYEAFLNHFIRAKHRAARSIRINLGVT